MAIRFQNYGPPADEVYLASAPSYVANHTWMGWVYISAFHASNWGCLFAISADSGNFETVEISVNYGGNSNRLVPYYCNSSNNNEGTIGATVLSTGRWYHVAFVRAGASSHIVYLDGAIDSNDVIDREANRVGASDTFEIGCGNRMGFTADLHNGRMAHVKVWTAALTQAEIRNEMRVAQPLRTSDLWAWYPMAGPAAARNLDFSRNGRNLTEESATALTTEDGPPVTWGGKVQYVGYAQGGGGGQSLVKGVGESLGLGDVVGRSRGLLRRLAEGGGLVETVARALVSVLGGYRIERRVDGGSWSEIDTVAESTTAYQDDGPFDERKLYEYRVTNLADSQVSNTAGVRWPLLRSIVEALGLVEIPSRSTLGQAIKKYAGEMLALSESVLRARSLRRSLADPLGLLEAAQKSGAGQAILKFASDLLGISERYRRMIFVPASASHRLDANIYGYTDGSAQQLVRTTDDRLWFCAWKFIHYPHGYDAADSPTGTKGMGQTLDMFRADQVGVPTTFTKVGTGPQHAICWGIAVGPDDLIHVAYVTRKDWGATYGQGCVGALSYAIFNVASQTWGTPEQIEDLPDYQEKGQGDELVALALDASGVPHVVYCYQEGTNRRHIYYRNRSGGSWSSPTQIDANAANTDYSHPAICFDQDGRIVVSYIQGNYWDGNDGQHHVKTYSGGSWSAQRDVQATATYFVGIDVVSRIYVDPSNRYHICGLSGTTKYVRYWYSDDDGATWTANHPSDQIGDDPSCGPGPGGKVRLWAHGPQGSNCNIVYWEAAGGSASWGSSIDAFTQNSTPHDCTVNVRWSRYHHFYPNRLDVAYWSNTYDTTNGCEVFFNCDPNVYRSVVDLTGLKEAIWRIRAGQIKKQIAEILSLTESRLRARRLSRARSESEGLSESASRSRSLVRGIVDSQALSEATRRLRAATKRAAESLGLIESSTRFLAKGLARSIADTLGLVESRLTRRGLIRASAASTGLSEAIARARALARSAMSQIGPSDALARARTLARQVQDQAGLAERVGRLRGLTRRAADTLASLEAAVSQKVQGGVAYVRYAADVLGLAEVRTARVAHGLVKAVVEAMSLVEARLRIAAKIRFGLDSESVSEIVRRARTLARGVAESPAVSESVGRARALRRFASDVEVLLERLAGIRGKLGRVADVLALRESAGRAKGFVRGMADVLGLAEARSRARGLVRIGREVLPIQEVARRALLLRRAIAESTSMGDSIARVRTIARRVADLQTLRDVAGILQHQPADLLVWAADTLGILEVRLRTRWPAGRLALAVSRESRRLLGPAVRQALAVARDARRLLGRD